MYTQTLARRLPLVILAYRAHLAAGQRIESAVKPSPELGSRCAKAITAARLCWRSQSPIARHNIRHATIETKAALRHDVHFTSALRPNVRGSKLGDGSSRAPPSALLRRSFDLAERQLMSLKTTCSRAGARRESEIARATPNFSDNFRGRSASMLKCAQQPLELA